MRWWPESDPRRDTWAELAAPAPGRGDVARECCYARCQAHGHALYAIVEFLDLRPVRVLEVGIEENWPPSVERL